MSGLFDTPVEPEIGPALEILRTAEETYGVAWPYQEERDIKMLRAMKLRHPVLDLASITEGFMMWCLGDDERVSKIRNWPQTLWTRVKNEERFQNRNRGGVSRSEVSRTGHTVVSETLTFGW